MPIVVNEKYDQLKVDRLKNFLENMAAKGQSRYYEIYVDSLKVIPKTDDPKEFDNYESFVDENTEKVRIVIYLSGASPRNDQYCYYMQGAKQDKGLNGLGDLDGIIQEKLAARDREYEMNRLKDELAETKKQLEEAEEYADVLQQQLEETKTNKFKLGNINIGELASVALEGMIRRNPQLLTKLPGGESLAGIIEQDNQEKQQLLTVPVEPDGGASFQKKNADSGSLKPEHLQYIPVLQQLDGAFNTADLEMVMQILQRLSEEPANLKTVAELLNIQFP
jgi:hypothetical protein